MTTARDDVLNMPTEEPRVEEAPRGLPFRVLAAVAILSLIGGALGAFWASSRADRYEAFARASYIDWLEPGAADAERARVVALVGDIAPLASDVTNGEIEIATPEARNFFDVFGQADTADEAIQLANAGAAALVEAEQADETRRIEEQLERTTIDSGTLQGRIDALAAEMELLLAAEAAAEAARKDAVDGAAVEMAIIDAREASESYWELTRRRNALIDEQTRFDRELVQIRADLAQPSDLELTTPAIEAHTIVENSPLIGFAGGAAAVLGLALLVWALWDPRTHR